MRTTKSPAEKIRTNTRERGKELKRIKGVLIDELQSLSVIVTNDLVSDRPELDIGVKPLLLRGRTELSEAINHITHELKPKKAPAPVGKHTRSGPIGQREKTAGETSSE